MYVPIVQIRIEPLKNGNRPGIESNHRPVRCPPYMVPLFKAKWGQTAKVVNVPIEDAENVDRLWKVPKLPGLSHCDSEVDRLKKYFGKRCFSEVYRESEFEAAFDKIATESNPADERRAKRDEEIAAQAVQRAAKGVMDAATSAAVGAERKAQVRSAALGKSKKLQTVPADEGEE